jgi:Zn-dependent peptidase ImmA (M78 family)
MGILDKIKDNIKDLVKKNKTRNPFELAEALEIILVESSLKDGLNGCYHEKAGFQFIYINRDLPYEKRLMVAAHELGHAILHRGRNILYLSNNTYYTRGTFEREANLFAAELLLEDDFFEKYKHIENCTLEYVSKCECVSYELVDYKLKYLSE